MDRSILDGYDPQGFYCEMLGSPASAAVRERLSCLSIDALKERAAAANAELYNLGITFTVYSDAKTIDRILPFDVLPRVLSAAEWRHLESGIIQRITALNLLLDDIYHDQHALRDGIVPADLILGNHNYRPLMRGIDVPHKTYINICGTDIVRDEKGAFLVLEDNARTPSGVSYVVENRHMMLRAFPDLLDDISLRPIDNYGAKLIAALQELAPRRDRPTRRSCCCRPAPTTRPISSMSFWRARWACHWSRGRDLVVEDDRVYMRTTGGLARVDVIYRRINDDFLDPEAFIPTSMLGVPGLMRAYRAGKVAPRQRDRHRRRRRQGGLCLYAADHPLLSRRGADPAQRRNPYLPRAGSLALHARSSGRAGGQAGRRSRRLRHHRRPEGEPRRTR